MLKAGAGDSTSEQIGEIHSSIEQSVERVLYAISNADSCNCSNFDVIDMNKQLRNVVAYQIDLR